MTLYFTSCFGGINHLHILQFCSCMVHIAMVRKASCSLLLVVSRALTSFDAVCTQPQPRAHCCSSSPSDQSLVVMACRALLPTQLRLVANLTAAIQSRDLDAAKAAYTRSRPVYEQIEVGNEPYCICNLSVLPGHLCSTTLTLMIWSPHVIPTIVLCGTRTVRS